ncbi:MAG: TerD family protein [Paraclostridium sp.]
MKVNLSKGEAINLSKVSNGGAIFEFGAGWDTSAIGNTDIDVSAVLVGADGKALGEEGLIFFRRLTSVCGGVKLSGDNRTGKGEGYDEVMTVDTSKISADVKRIPIIVSIYSGAPNFGLVKNLNIDAIDKTTNTTLASFIPELEASTSKAIVVGEIVRAGNDFHFKASGNGFADLGTALADYGFTN